MVRNFFKMEANGIRPAAETMLTTDEKRALLHAQNTVRHDRDGDCYYVGLPKTYDGATLPNNYGLASMMLQRQLKKFAHQPELAKNFADQMQIYCDRFARKLSTEELHANFPCRNYLIHHGVTHEQNPGRVRVVCNAPSASHDQSLNGIILLGPNLLNDMPTVITRLCEFPVWVTSDIVKFFHHVGVVEEDQMMLSYLWSPPGSSGPPEVWCMTRQPFGVVSSPFLSLFCLNRCAEDNRHEFPLVVETPIKL